MPKRTGLTAHAVADAALTLLDTEGRDGVTMRKVAAALDVSAMTLYSYVADRDALLDDVAQLVYSRIAVPGGTAGPRATLRALMHAVRDVLRAHPHALPLVARFPPRTLPALAFVETGFAALRAAGVPPLDVARCYRALAAYSLGTATVEANHYFGPEAVAGAAAPSVDEEQLRERLPSVAEVGPVLAELDDDAEFDYGLDLILDGFLHRHAPD